MNQNNFEAFNDAFMTVAPIAVLFFIFGIIAFIVTIAYIVRLWLVQSSTFQIQKDVADIRDHLLGYQVEEVRSDSPQAVDKGNIEPIREKKKIELKPPRKVFIWVAISIPILLVCLVVSILVQQ